MNRHDIADQEVVPAQFLAFALACALVLFSSLFPSAFSSIAYKLADAGEHQKVWGNPIVQSAQPEEKPIDTVPKVRLPHTF